MEKRKSNYEIMKRQMQAKFASFDLSQIAGEWELEQKNGSLALSFVGRQYEIDRSTGAVLYERDGAMREADYNVSMTLFDILTRKRQRATGKLLPVSAFSAIHSATASSGGPFDAVARRFDHRDGELSAACERLGSVPYGKGDVAYRLPVFKDLWTGLQFWDSDEDFGPSLNFLCDSNILQFMYYETMMFMLIHILDRLNEAI